MSNPHIMCCSRLKNDGWIMAMPFVLILPCHRTIIPCPTHIVNGSKHPWPTSLFIFCQDPLSIFISGIPQVLCSIYLDHSAKSSHTLEDRSSPSEHRHGWHRRASISKNLHDCYYLQQWTCTFYPVAFLLNTNQGSCLSTALAMVLK